MKDVKIVIGANYGDEGKGLMTRHFCREALVNDGKPIIIFHNGTAQRGHTVDYTPSFRHVYHHFGSGTGDGVSTYFANTFLIHPMEFRRELIEELIPNKIKTSICFCDPGAKVITPLDMVVDHATEEHIAKLNGEPEFGSCGYGSWCAVEDRLPMGTTAYTIEDFSHIEMIPYMMEKIWSQCIAILCKRGVDLEKTRFAHVTKDRSFIIKNFTSDIQFFLTHVRLAPFDSIWNAYDSFIFENGQGLGLDMNVDNDWHTTSNTGLTNPITLLADKTDYSAEACYVSRSYLTRHGVGPLEEAVKKEEINAHMHDRTNAFNNFQGNLRYGYTEELMQSARIQKDWAQAKNNPRFKKTLCLTHCNEFPDLLKMSDYYSDNPFTIEKRK